MAKTIPDDIALAAYDMARKLMLHPEKATIERSIIAAAILAERDRIKAIILEHEPLAGAYVHDLIRAIDNDR